MTSLFLDTWLKEFGKGCLLGKIWIQSLDLDPILPACCLSLVYVQVFSRTTVLVGWAVRNVNIWTWMFSKSIYCFHKFFFTCNCWGKKEKKRYNTEMFRSLKCHKMHNKKSLTPRASQRRHLSLCKNGVIKYLNPFRVCGFQFFHADKCQTVRQLCLRNMALSIKQFLFVS